MEIMFAMLHVISSADFLEPLYHVSYLYIKLLRPQPVLAISTHDQLLLLQTLVDDALIPVLTTDSVFASIGDVVITIQPPSRLVNRSSVLVGGAN